MWVEDWLNGRTSDPIAPPSGLTVELSVSISGGSWMVIGPAVLMPPTCIDPNAEMQQRDAMGIINGGPSKKLLEAARKLRETTKKLDDALRPRDPGQGLDVVAPMDHRLGRFKC